MSQSLDEIVAYYKRQGAPGDQTALIAMLKELQQECGGSLSAGVVRAAAQSCGVRESFLLAVIKRIPSLRLGEGHLLELCGGPNCGKHRALAACAEQLCAASQGKVTLKFMPCMRMCGKGPNLRWDGVLHHGADEGLLRDLFSRVK